MKRESQRAIEELKKQYAGDSEAMEVIEKSIKDVEYIESKEAEGNYTGQSSKQYISGLDAFLHDWY